MDEKVSHSLKLIRDALNSYTRVAVACSFGKDSMVTLHLIRKCSLNVPVFAVMTPFKPKETFDFMKKTEREWNLNLKVYRSKEKVPADLYKTDPDKCCYLLKVLPTMEAVKDLDAWFAGLRRSEGVTRGEFSEMEKKGSLVKVNPILCWTEADVWRYTAVNKIPVHPWYGQGYRSLGCACCSKPNAEIERGGRWMGTEKCGGECGIHTRILKK